MKKSTLLWLIVAAALVVSGIAIIGGVSTMIGFDFNMLSTNDYETNEHVITDEFDKISIVTNTADVKFVVSEDESVKIVCHERQKVKHRVSVNDGDLLIQRHDERKWYDYIGISWQSAEITVYMPKSMLVDLKIETNTGKVDIPKGYKFESIDIKTDTGGVKLFCSANGEVKVRSDTGYVNIQGSTASLYDVHVSTGNVSLTNVRSSGNVKVGVTTGKTVAKLVRCASFISKGDTGDVSMTDVVAKEKFSIERSTGDVVFSKCDAEEISVLTDTGDVRGTLLSSKVFIVRTDTGDVFVPETTEGGKCKITTDTGDVRITVQPTE